MIDTPKHSSAQANSPSELDDDALLARLFEIQVDVRDILLRYQIKPTTLIGMARQAKRAISSSETRADLLELLIELQEFGAAAKERGVIGEAAMSDKGVHTSGASAASAKRRGSPAEASPDDISEAPVAESDGKDTSKINQTLSDEFFQGLNEKRKR